MYTSCAGDTGMLYGKLKIEIIMFVIQLGCLLVYRQYCFFFNEIFKDSGVSLISSPPGYMESTWNCLLLIKIVDIIGLLNYWHELAVKMHELANIHQYKSNNPFII
jgi:hypothetical protein